MTTGRLRRGIILALAGLLVGLGLVLVLDWSGHLSQDEAPPQGTLSALSPEATPQGTVAGEPARDKPDGTKPGEATPGDGKVAPEAEKPHAGVGDAGKAAQAAGVPRFDIVRVEPNGDAVVAGRGSPNTVIEMLVDGKPVAKALADPNGQFAIVSPALPKGSSEIMLRSRTADGQESRSSQSVAVSVSPEGKSRPLVALTAPDAPTVVLSQPDSPETIPTGRADTQAGGGGKTAAVANSGAPNPASTHSGGTGQAAKPAVDAPTRIVSVDSEPGGRLFVTGAGKRGTDVRLYLNDTLIAPGKIGPDGRVTFTIGRGVAQGRYQVRIDEIDPRSGRVLHRAEVPFAMPQQIAEATKPDQTKAAGKSGPKGEPGIAATGQPPGPSVAGTAQRGGPMAATAPSASLDAAGRIETAEGRSAPGAVFVPAIAATRITRGDSLWQISKRIYGRGERYTVIYDANQAQIRDPDLIYPGQIFVLPNDQRG